MGLGIAAMHYLGMSALRAQCVVTYSPPLVGAERGGRHRGSDLGPVAAPSAQRDTWLIRAASVVLGLAVALMHFTGMAAASFLPARGWT